MENDFKIIDYQLYRYVFEEIKKRYPNMEIDSNGLGQGSLRENRWLKIYLSDNVFVEYSKGIVTLRFNELKDISLIEDENVEKEGNGSFHLKSIITKDGKTNGQQESEVLDSILYMVRYFEKLTCPQEQQIINNEEKEDLLNKNDIQLKTWTLDNLLFQPLKIPKYQRAYEWQSEHVNDLLNDLYDAYRQGKPYILGTIILYLNNLHYEIVDGQQRLITLSILLRYSIEENGLLEMSFNSLKSQYYIKNTGKLVEEFKNGKGDDFYKFLDYLRGEKVTFSVLLIPNGQQSKAFTFFDSLNSKGVTLSDFDLLKAHHLMYIPENQESLARKHNDDWQSKDNKHKDVFDNMLRQIRIWSRGHGEEGGGERPVYKEFVSAVDIKDLDKDEHVFNRYMQPNVFRSWSRENGHVVLNMKYPSQNVEDLIPMEIPQTIEGGDAFFLYANRYHNISEQLFGDQPQKRSSAMQYAYELSKSIGNTHLRNAYKAIILQYFDKFSDQKLVELSTCIELILSKFRFPNAGGKTFIREGSVKNYVKEKNVIPFILNSTFPHHALAQIITKIGNTPFEAKGYTENAQRKYKENISDFYTHHIHIIHEDSIKSLVKHLYSIKNNGN